MVPLGQRPRNPDQQLARSARVEEMLEAGT